MPSESDHLTKAKQNEEFADSLGLNGRTEVEWALTALFYSALHYVEAYFDKTLGAHSANHGNRDKMIHMDRSLKRVFPDYQELKTLGWTARYEPTKFGRQAYVDAKPHLNAIKAVIGY